MTEHEQDGQEAEATPIGADAEAQRDTDEPTPEGEEVTSAEETGFAALGLSPRLLEAIAALGYEEPTPIQREAIPMLLEGRDLLGQAATGTGKTAAFALPLLERISAAGAGGDDERPIRALVLVPTRELAIQVADAFHKYGRRAFGITTLPVYGGQPIGAQLRSLRRGVDVVVGTPGRVLDHINRGSMDLSAAGIVVLDEADEMLDMGFADDLEAILAAAPKERQTALFSATMARRVSMIAERHLHQPARITLAREQVAAGDSPRVRQTAYLVRRPQKIAALGRVLDMESPAAAIVFCRTRNEVDELVETLGGRGYRAESLHGGHSQEQRDRVMRRFRDGAVELLVATDVAARGLDVGHISHVINYDVPSAPEAYVHRIGRTGRAGRTGVAITFAEPREHRMLRNIEQATKQKIAFETVPTVVDLRARRLEVTRASLREVLLAGNLDGYRVAVDALTDEFDVMDIAMAAVKLLHEADGPVEDDEQDIARVDPPGGGRGERPRGDRPFGRAPEWTPRPGAARAESRPVFGETGKGATRAAARGGDKPSKGPPRRGAGRNEGGPAMTRLYIGLGRQNGMRPADIVGAIANEAEVDSKHIGAIEIADRFSIVEVPEAASKTIITRLRGATLRGKKVLVREDRDR